MYTDGLDRTGRAEADEFLTLPFGMHPDQTPAAKRERASMLMRLKSEG